MAQAQDLTVGRTLPLLLKFTIPLLLGQVLQQTYSLIDAALVGRYLGIHSLAAIGASSSVLFLILGFCNGTAAGLGIPVAQAFGAKDTPAIRKYVRNAICLTGILSVSLALVTCLLCGRILHWMSTPGEIYEQAHIYLFITFLSIPCTFFYNLFGSILRALGDSRTPLLMLILSAGLNIALDILFILVFNWGVAGAAFATMIAQAISALLCYRIMVRDFRFLRTIVGDRIIDSRTMLRLLAIGAPMGLQFSITAIGSIMLQSSNNMLGTACAAAFTAGMRIKMLFIIAFESLGMAIATFSGQNIGAGKPQRVLEGVKTGYFLSGLYCLGCILVLSFLSEEIVSLFVPSENAEIAGLACTFLHTTVIFYPMLASLSVLRYAIQGVGYTNFAMCSGVMEMIARVLVSLFLVPYAAFQGVCFGDPLAWVAANIFLIPAFIFVYRKLASRRTV